jgi:hypothetical protein
MSKSDPERELEPPRGPRDPRELGSADSSLIRWALSLEPIERLRYVERMNASIAKLRALNEPKERP